MGSLLCVTSPNKMLEISHPSLFALLLFMLRFATPPVPPPNALLFIFLLSFLVVEWFLLSPLCTHFCGLSRSLSAFLLLGKSAASSSCCHLSPVLSFPFVDESNLFLASSSIDPVALSLRIALASVIRKAFSVYNLSLSLSLFLSVFFLSCKLFVFAHQALITEFSKIWEIFL